MESGDAAYASLVLESELSPPCGRVPSRSRSVPSDRRGRAPAARRGGVERSSWSEGDLLRPPTSSITSPFPPGPLYLRNVVSLRPPSASHRSSSSANQPPTSSDPRPAVWARRSGDSSGGQFPPVSPTAAALTGSSSRDRQASHGDRHGACHGDGGDRAQVPPVGRALGGRRVAGCDRARGRLSRARAASGNRRRGGTSTPSARGRASSRGPAEHPRFRESADLPRPDAMRGRHRAGVCS
jgi:hypothetical protein